MSVENLFKETRLLFNTLKLWAEGVHPGSEITLPMRAVLELLLLEGAATVPAMARSRSVSRQHIQQRWACFVHGGNLAPDRRDLEPATKCRWPTSFRQRHLVDD